MKSKRQTTMAKLARERLVQERRALKREKKRAAAAAREADATTTAGDGAGTDAVAAPDEAQAADLAPRDSA